MEHNSELTVNVTKNKENFVLNCSPSPTYQSG